MRVLLAEDHKIVRQGTRMYLESMGVEIVGEATTGVEAVRMARELQPDVVVMDIHMPELTGVEATRRILDENSDVRILVLTAYDDPVYVYALLDAGADGFVLKTAELSQLYQALQDVAVGRSAFDADVMAKAARHVPTTTMLVEGLTDREIEILMQAARGLTNKQIGKTLFISDRTVQGHLQNVYQKLGVTTRTEAVTGALARGLISLVEGGQS
ncbi:MAG: response regulator transcription factor [Anaerolineae bacterium]|nr:response regulator transcription factor [Anaerolineae bacterium]